MARAQELYYDNSGQPYLRFGSGGAFVSGADYDASRNGVELGTAGVSVLTAEVDIGLPSMNLTTQTGDVNITEAKQSVLVILAVIAMMILLFKKG